MPSKKLFLTSSVHAVAQAIAAQVDLSKGNNLVFITTPAEPETGDLQWLANDRQALVDAGFAVTDYTITGKTEEQLRSDLVEYDFIYVSGGNTLYMFKQSQATGFLSVIRWLVLEEHKTYIGTSTGSIIAGNKCPDYLLDESETLALEDKEGYGFVNVTVLPHWGSEDFRELYLGNRLSLAYRDDQVPLLALTDHQYLEVTGESLQVHSV